MGNKLLPSAAIEEDGIHSELSWEEVENDIDNDYDFLDTEMKSTIGTIPSFGITGTHNCDSLSVMSESSMVTSLYYLGDIENVTFEDLSVPPFKEERLLRGRRIFTLLYRLPCLNAVTKQCQVILAVEVILPPMLQLALFPREGAFP